MEWIIGGIILGAAMLGTWLVLRKKQKASSSHSAPKAPPPLPDGYVVYADNVWTAGLGYQKEEVQAFAHGQHHALGYILEPSHLSDPHAMQVVGYGVQSGQKVRFHLGYLPQELSKALYISGYEKHARARLTLLELHDGEVKMRHQLLGPKAGKKSFDRALQSLKP